MTENFVSRWARLKRNSEIKHRTEAGEDSPQHFAAEVSAASAEVPTAQAAIDPAADEPFDVATLPSIETITANTDVRGFLQSRVPSELTRAALRRAWTSDPAIRDFIGIAENQWDFNDPNAIPGFGPLRDMDKLPALLARAMGEPDRLAGMIAEMPASVEQSLTDVIDRTTADASQTEQPRSDGSPLTSNIRQSAHNKSGEVTAANSDRIAELDVSTRIRRSHGSARPR